MQISELVAGIAPSPTIAGAAKAKAVWKHFDATVGLKHIRVFHVNDSKGKVGSHLDRHEHLGDGECGKPCFQALAKTRADKDEAEERWLELAELVEG